ncbi:hypothetical protein I3842_05G096400 [Carya illinoinensis]|uniref:Calnexin n=1 Tax=Carya illinoinensis TaxID=32201 RepID=A0A922F2W8_CARIL|nr:hypothetical protein I3842_05G096400 [Carya illinoinensis]
MMMELRWRIPQLPAVEQCIAVLLIASFAFQICASASDVIYYETFDESFEGRWVVSQKDDYKGVWKHSKSEGHDDYGLLVSEKARKYAIVKELDQALSLKDETIVLQFEVRLQDGLECGGAYLKYLRPQETIPDPDDKKPEDWDERAKIPDPEAVKPDDWDEDAPMEIEDEEAVKPEGWLDDEPEEVDDPDAAKPEDWDDEEDGEWEAPKIDNPKCEVAPGCGVWKRPMKRNPAYKGKWHAPLIDNPNYKGIWKPQDIPNPDYFELEKPDFEPIAAIGIEIWTMQDGILFDNILIAGDEKSAESYRLTTWKPKFEDEKEKQKAEEAATGLSEGLSDFQKKVFDFLYKIGDIPFLDAYKPKIIDLIEKGEKQPNITIGVIVSIVLVILTIFFRLLFGGKKPAINVSETSTDASAETSTNQESIGEKEREDENEDDADAAAPRRRPGTRRDQ